MICPKCGVENREDAKFCKNCATPLEENNSGEGLANSNVSEIKSSSDNSNESNNFNSSEEVFSNSNADSNKKSEKNNNTIIIAVTAIICVLIVAGTFVVLGTDLLDNSNDNSVSNETNVNQTDNNKTNVTKSDSKSSDNEMTFVQAKKLMKGSSNTVIRNTFDEADANGDGVLTGNEISRFKYLADLTDRTADSSNTEHVEATDQGAGDGTTKTRYCTTHGRVAVGSDNLCPYCLEEGLDARTVKDSTEYV